MEKASRLGGGQQIRQFCYERDPASIRLHSAGHDWVIAWLPDSCITRPVMAMLSTSSVAQARLGYIDQRVLQIESTDKMPSGEDPYSRSSTNVKMFALSAVLALFLVAPSLAASSPPLENSPIEDKFNLYAYGDGISGLPVFYADGKFS